MSQLLVNRTGAYYQSVSNSAGKEQFYSITLKGHSLLQLFAPAVSLLQIRGFVSNFCKFLDEYLAL